MGWIEVKLPCDTDYINSTHTNKKARLQKIEEWIEGHAHRIYLIKDIDSSDNITLRKFTLDNDATVNLTASIADQDAEWSINMTSTTDNYEDLGTTTVQGGIMSVNPEQNTLKLGKHNSEDVLVSLADNQKPSVGDIIWIKNVV